jgi:RNA polymerase sigma-70 factor, ECF subfamily
VNQTVSPERFHEVVNLYGGYVYTLAYRILGNPCDAEEAAQETFVKAYKNLDRYDETKGLKNWLCTIALNTARDFYRRSRRERKMVSDGVEVEELSDQRQAGVHTENRIDIKKILSLLELKYRTVVVLFYMEQCSIKEIGCLLNKPENLIKIWLFRARKKIMERYGASLL